MFQDFSGPDVIALLLGRRQHQHASNGQFAQPITNQYIRWGASPRGAQTIALAAKVRALLDSRYNVSFEDVRRVYLPALRPRILLNFEAQAEGIEPDRVLLELLAMVAVLLVRI